MTPAFLIVDKPPGLTSHDVVAIVRAVTGIKKVGHTGTLDPFATGVLVLALGMATKMIQYLSEDLKIYDMTMKFGESTTTGDPEGETLETRDIPSLTPDVLQPVLDKFLGEQLQEPPRYSAVKVKGRPLYAYAREGKDVRAKARPIRIDKIEPLHIDAPHVRLRVECGRGTYARVLSEDIGQALKSCAHLSQLRRERSGPFEIARAISMPALAEIVAGDQNWEQVFRRKRGEDRVQWLPREQVHEGLKPWLIPPMDVLGHLQRVNVPPAIAGKIRKGAPLPPPSAEREEGKPYLITSAGEMVALGVWKGTKGKSLIRI